MLHIRISNKSGVRFLAVPLVASLQMFISVEALAAADGHWQILAPTGQEVQPGRPYSLQNLSNKDVLKYGHQRFGINLKNVGIDPKDKKGPSNIVFSREGNAAGPLTYGERISIEMKRGAAHGEYLYYTQRDAGPNLGWSKNRKFEWELRGGKCGEKVKTHVPLALYSRVEKDFLVYCERPLGVNLRWLKDKDSKGCQGLFKTAAKKGAAKLAEIGTDAACAHAGGEAGVAACKSAGLDKKAGALVEGSQSDPTNTSSLAGCE